MVVRIAGYGYQKGFGGHFHNDNAVGVLRDIPGLVDRLAGAARRRRRDAAHLRRRGRAPTARVCVFLEPIALYHTRDLHEPGDGGWLAPYDAPERWREPTCRSVAAGRTATGSDLTIVTFGNGLYR